MNADRLFLGGVNPNDVSLQGLPAGTRTSLIGCIEAPEFVQYNTEMETPQRINLDNQVITQRYFLKSIIILKAWGLMYLAS